MNDGARVLLVAVVLASVFGAYRATRDDRFRGTRALPGLDQQESSPPASRPTGVDLADSGLEHALGARATLLQFSSAFCAPCRATRRVLADVADLVPGVTHIEVDAEQHLDLVRRLGIVRTPTTLILGQHGQEVARAAGAPRKEEVLTGLAEAFA